MLATIDATGLGLPHKVAAPTNIGTLIARLQRFPVVPSILVQGYFVATLVQVVPR